MTDIPYALHHGDCIEVMATLDENSVDAIVTDPPYELGFMGKSWDSTGIAFNPEVWKQALRVLKPGGHLLAFSGSRTYHRMAVAIEDAGFEIRDQIMWIYGSGFPKSLNISKALDKDLGAPIKKGKAFKVAGEYGSRNLRDPELQGESRDEMRHKAITDEAQQWQGWGTALKPAHEPLVLARKPLIGTVAANVLTYGTGGLNIDGGRVEGESIETTNGTANAIYGDLSKNGGENWKSHNLGRWPANVIHDGSDEVIELFPESKGMATQRSGKNIKIYGGNALQESKTQFPDIRQGFNDSGTAARFFYCAKANKRDRNEGLEKFEAIRVHDGRAEGGVGGSNPRNRTNNYKQNHHPTVKPTDLMEYLCRLITPKGGTVLDPFMGSGSTGKACMYEGYRFIGIEQEQEYLEIAQARIEFALQSFQDTIF